MSQVVRLKKGKKVFEVLTNEGAALRYKDGKADWSEVLYTDVVFKNSTKGDRHKEEDIASAFDTTDMTKALQAIVKEGDIELSSGERKEAVEAKKLEIIQYLHKNYLDPKSKLPHPVVRLEQAIETSKLRVDPDASAVKQAEALIKLMLGKLLFAKSEIEGQLTLANKYMGPCANIVHGMANVKSESYTPQGVTWDLGIAPGDFDGFVAALNSKTKGDYQFAMHGASQSSKSESDGKKQGKKKKGKKK